MKSLLIIDPLADDKGHLLDDDYFWVKGLGPHFSRITVISSKSSVDRIKNEFPWVEAIPHPPSTSLSRFSNHLEYLRRMKAPPRGYGVVLLQSFSEFSTLLFRYLHPGYPIHTIVTNNLSGAGALTLKRRLLHRILFKRVQGIWVHTGYEKRLILERYPGVNASSVHILPFHKISVQRPIMPLKDRRRRIVFLGRDDIERGLDDFLSLALADTDGRFEYGVYGHFRLDPGRRGLIARIRAHIEFYRGYLDEREYFRVLGESLCVAMPYKESFEGRLSGVYCDAISCGTPVIASPIEPFREFFGEYGEMGILAWMGEGPGTEKVLGMDYDSRWASFQEAMQKAREHHSEEKVIQRALDILGSRGTRG